MGRIVAGLGAHNEIVATVQNALAALGYMRAADVDRWYGPGTATAVRSFQRAQRMPESGTVDDDTWRLLLPNTATPSLQERCLALTAAFEGHDYTLAVGNFDGAWLTWGIVGFTLKHGEVQKILREVENRFPNIITVSFGTRAAELRDLLTASSAQQQQWADSVTTPKGMLAEPWRTAFRLLGSHREVQAIQQRLAIADYYVPAQQTATRWGLTSELGMALCFDIHVQNGGISKRAAAQIKTGSTEAKTRLSIANAVAACARAAYRDDVRGRKLAIATGRGRVHGSDFDLMNWGLGEFSAEVPRAASATAGK